ncbi:MAG: N-acetyltransferase [Sphingomonadales bacterium]|nr:MAG: N-acetyltransferase [Sphingomonadales bacterium]
MTDADLPFTALLYASTRNEELAVTGWPPEAIQAFLAQQHAAQHAHYQQHYKGMDALIVEHDGTPIGRLYLYEAPQDLRVVDIALLPEARRRGFGAAMLGDILAYAGTIGKNVSIHVEISNPARTLYARLGFEIVESDGGAYDLWEWRGSSAQ